MFSKKGKANQFDKWMTSLSLWHPYTLTEIKEKMADSFPNLCSLHISYLLRL